MEIVSGSFPFPVEFCSSIRGIYYTSVCIYIYIWIPFLFFRPIVNGLRMHPRLNSTIPVHVYHACACTRVLSIIERILFLGNRFYERHDREGKRVVCPQYLSDSV